MIETQMFLLFFGAVLTLIGVVIFFLLAWFKETTGESNVVKILQAEFRLSNPGLVIFIGGLGLMVAPFFLGQTPSGDKSPEPTPTPTLAPTPTFTPGPLIQTPEPIAPAPILGVTPVASINTPQPPTLTPEPTATPMPTPTPEPSPTPTTAPELVDIAGRWSNLQSHVDFFGNSVEGYNFVVYDNFGGIIAQGTASFDGYLVNSVGTNAFGLPFSAELFLVDNSTLEGTEYDAFHNPTQFITLVGKTAASVNSPHPRPLSQREREDHVGAHSHAPLPYQYQYRHLDITSRGGFETHPYRQRERVRWVGVNWPGARLENPVPAAEKP